MTQKSSTRHRNSNQSIFIVKFCSIENLQYNLNSKCFKTIFIIHSTYQYPREQLTLNQLAGGSSPPGCTKSKIPIYQFGFLFRVHFITRDEKFIPRFSAGSPPGCTKTKIPTHQLGFLFRVQFITRDEKFIPRFSAGSPPGCTNFFFGIPSIINRISAFSNPLSFRNKILTINFTDFAVISWVINTNRDFHVLK